jgi:hypothetical protein
MPSKMEGDSERDEGFGSGTGQGGFQDDNNLAADKAPGATDVGID